MALPSATAMPAEGTLSIAAPASAVHLFDATTGASLRR
jgi:hypothetical protein